MPRKNFLPVQMFDEFLEFFTNFIKLSLSEVLAVLSFQLNCLLKFYCNKFLKLKKNIYIYVFIRREKR